jgi:UDP-glucose:glycoprotein glucosyltransferase
LARARAIPEWEEYDAEIAKFAKRLEKEGLLHTGIAAEGADALAGSSTHALQEAPKDEPVSHDEL